MKAEDLSFTGLKQGNCYWKNKVNSAQTENKRQR